jgi:nitroimidazol reductase NimA-like FMN-containing flavoprotein (pyridoxamine 5'-phosphate oxidase superfamily)
MVEPSPGGATRDMRKAAREISGQAELAEVLERSRHLFLAIHDDPAPYILPLFYGFTEGRIYIHCAAEGTKLQLIAKNPRVSFGAAEEPRIVAGESACGFSGRSRSVIGQGTARVVSDERERVRGLDAIMRHYGVQAPSYRPDSLARTCVLAIDIQGMRGKKIG